LGGKSLEKGDRKATKGNGLGENGGEKEDNKEKSERILYCGRKGS